MMRVISALAALLGVCSLASQSQAQQYPDRPVKIVVGFAAGSGPDLQARTVGQQLAIDLGQQFYVENKLGANGTIAARSVATAAPDGYTLLFSSSSIAPTPYIYKNTGYDLLNDLTPIATVGELDGIFMLVNAASPVKTVPEFIAYAKKNGVRPLAFTGSKPFRAFPEVPLMKQYLPDFVQGSWGMFFAPGKTPDPIINQLNTAVHAALLNPTVASVMQRDGYMPDTRNAAKTASFFRQKVEESADLVKAAGIQAN